MKILQFCAGGLYAPALTEELKKLGHEVILADVRQIPGMIQVPPVTEIEKFRVSLQALAWGTPDLAFLPHNQDEALVVAEMELKALLSPSVTIQEITDKLRFLGHLDAMGLCQYRFGALKKLPISCDLVSGVLKPRRGCGSQGIIELGGQEKEYLWTQRLFGDEYTVDAIFHQGVLLDWCARKRLKIQGGICVDAEIVGQKEVFEKDLEAMGQYFHFNGPFAIQCFLEKGWMVNWTDCNHRFGGGSALSMLAGWRGVENYCRLLEGKDPVTSKIRQCRIRRAYKAWIESDELALEIKG